MAGSLNHHDVSLQSVFTAPGSKRVSEVTNHLAEQPHGLCHPESERIGGDRMADRDFLKIWQRFSRVLIRS